MHRFNKSKSHRFVVKESIHMYNSACYTIGSLSKSLYESVGVFISLRSSFVSFNGTLIVRDSGLAPSWPAKAINGDPLCEPNVFLSKKQPLNTRHKRGQRPLKQEERQSGNDRYSFLLLFSFFYFWTAQARSTFCSLCRAAINTALTWAGARELYPAGWL